MDVAEIAIRIGETMIDRAWVAAGEQFWIGEMPGTQLAVAGLGAFPLVTGTSDGFVLRVPVGTVLVLDGRTCGDRELRLDRDRIAVLAFGLATAEIRLVALPRIAIPRPPPELRPAVYTMVSLLAHLSLWAAAIELAPDLGFGGGRYGHVVSIGGYHRFAPSVIEAAPTPASVEPVLAQTERPRARTHAHHVAHAHGASEARDGSMSDLGESTAAAVAEVAKSFDGLHLDRALSNVGAIYRPDEAPGFGRTRLFDPTNRPEFRTIPSGRFATTSTGPHAGAGYDIAGTVELCADAGCQVSGPIDGAQLRDAIGTTSAHLGGCFGARHGTVIIELSIDEHGHADARGSAGTRDIAACAARLVASIEFSPAEASTLASISIAH
jgi:hypothetical protein